MEAAVVTPEAPPDPDTSHNGQAEATRSTAELFQWSGYVHVGAGAEDCEHRLDGQCRERSHFHAWVCLPNPYQIRDVQQKAHAARARKVRALRDVESDSGSVLEQQLDDIRRDQLDELVETIASRRVDEDLLDIIRDVQGRTEFENQSVDAEEFQRLTQIPEAERSTEEAEDFKRLEAQMLNYGKAMQDIIEQRRIGEADRLKKMEPDKLIAIEREHRIKALADETFLFTYYQWVIYVGTREPVAEGFPHQRKFKDPAAQHAAAPEVVNALRDKLRELEQATTVEQRGDAAGNS